eukprot:COSAG02_NODE_23_length_52893_cov_58.101868_14_plen_66_part_00
MRAIQAGHMPAAANDRGGKTRLCCLRWRREMAVCQATGREMAVCQATGREMAVCLAKGRRPPPFG